MNNEDTIIKNLKATSQNMSEAVTKFQHQLAFIQTNRPSPSVFHNVMVDYYGVLTPLHQTAIVVQQGGGFFIIKPHNVDLKKNVLSALAKSNLEIDVKEEPTQIRVKFQPLTEDMRRQKVKEVKQTSEQFKITIRNLRRQFKHQLKQGEDAVPKSTVERYQTKIQILTDEAIKKIDLLTLEKNKTLMTI